MRVFLYGFMAIALWLSAPAAADVYRCEDPQQGIVYQQTPCPEPEEEAAEETEAEASEEPAEPRARSVVRRDQDVADVVAAA